MDYSPWRPDNCLFVQNRNVCTAQMIITIFAECFQIYTVLSRLNPIHILITSCSSTRLVLNCHLYLGFPSSFPGRFSPNVFYTSILPCFILSSFVRRSTAHSDHNYILPATFHLEKSVLNCIEIRPLDWGETQLYALRTKSAQWLYNESVTVIPFVLYICIFSC